MELNKKSNSQDKEKLYISKSLLKSIRRCVAIISILLITPLFLDFTGLWQELFGWMAKIQFLPALFSLNFIVIISLILLTLLFGRLYCSIICPLGIMQDGFGWLGKKAKKNRYSYSKPLNILRYSFLGIMVIAFIAGLNAIVALLAPYSAYGRIISSLIKPIFIWCNNILASWAEQHQSYAFYNVEYWQNGYGVLIVAGVTLISLGILAWRNGRTYCNSICPVGTVLGFFSRFAMFRMVIDGSKCIDCKLCARNCKASCIDIPNRKIDYSRCVACFDCLDKCKKGALSFKFVGLKSGNQESEVESIDGSRRNFISTAAVIGSSVALSAADKTVDGGLATIEDKKIPERNTRIAPPGAISLRNLHNHCTACQLCVSACPNGVLRPMTDLENFMQPESSYERGYCRPECTRCSDVCPTGAIRPLDTAEKSSIQIGHAVWVKANCVPLTDGVECGNCARHCPTGAIIMVEADNGLKIPAVNADRCIGCGACENLCPARPFSAIYVEGHENHRTI